MSAPGYIVIDRQDASGTNTPNAREVVSFTGISGNDLTGCTRGADGSTARSHSNGALVETMPTVGMWNNLATIVGTAVTSDGYLKAIASPVSIAQMYISNYINTSGASVVGVFPSGASGAVLTSSGNTIVPVFSSAGALSSIILTATRDMTAASGNVAYTGAGFKPTSIICLSSSGTAGAVGTSWGYSDSAKTATALVLQGNGNYSIQARLSYMEPVTGNVQDASIATYDTDGFTLTWTKTATPTGTATLRFLCYK